MLVDAMRLNPEAILIKDYTYDLPHQRIAEFPLQQRDSSKLLIYRNGRISDDTFRNLSRHLSPPATIVFNNTRVIEARLLFQKETGGVIELFCLEPWQQSIEAAMQQQGVAEWKCLIGGASKLKPGQVLQLKQDGLTLQAHYIEKMQDSFRIRFEWQPEQIMFAELLHAFGLIPLPPYIKRKPEELDKERYQTVFSKHEGSVAAPTAALHFTNEVLEDLKGKGINTGFVTLHVGAGTFKPVKSESIAGHEMHGEPFVVSKELLEALAVSESIIAVGTTSIRTLESLYWLGIKLHHEPDASPELSQWEAYEWEEKAAGVNYQQSLQHLLSWMNQRSLPTLHCRTSIIIVPGYSFKAVKGLITNFHQPQSTLLLLIAAFVGEAWKEIYQHALQHDYRFLSYGDSSLLWRDK